MPETASRMKEARIAAGHTVSTFAVAVGVREPPVYRIEAGQTPSVGTLKRWAEVCGVTTDHLLGLSSQPEAAE